MLRFVVLSLGFSFAVFSALFMIFVVFGDLVDRLAFGLCHGHQEAYICGDPPEAKVR
jgi:hypothetical protein